MKKLTSALLIATALAALVTATPAQASGNNLTCNAPLTKHCLGWGRTVFCRCY